MVDRIARVNSLIQREIGGMLEKKLQDGRYGMLTVTEVRVSRDLRHARVFISVYGEEHHKIEAIAYLNRKKRQFQSELGKLITLKRMPELQFVLDETAEKSARLLEIFNQLESEDK